MKSQEQDMSVKSIASYLGCFKDAYLLSSVERYDIHGKKLLESNEKIYFEDIGLRNLIAGGERDRQGITHLGLREFLKNGF